MRAGLAIGVVIIVQGAYGDAYSALKALYEATNGAGWADNLLWDVSGATGNPCSPTWSRVTCTGSTVTGLDLSGQGLAGTLPASPWADLTALTGALNLWDNDIVGTLPTELGLLTSGGVKLRLGSHGENQQGGLSGTIPLELASNAYWKELYFRRSSLSGTLPTELASSLGMLTLDWYHNLQMSGTIPTEFGNLAKLRTLILENRQLNRQVNGGVLSGTLPSEFGKLAKVNIMTVQRHAKLSGTIPAGLFERGFLQWFNFLYNAVSGSIPSEIGQLTRRAIKFDIKGSSLSGTLPSQGAPSAVERAPCLPFSFEPLTHRALAHSWSTYPHQAFRRRGLEFVATD